MAIQRKSSLVISSQSANELPDYLVALPDEVMARFPSLRATQRQWEDYHELVKKSLTRLIDEQNRARAITQQTIDTLQSTITDLQSQITALASTPTVAATPTVDLSPLESELAAHIAATTAHGTGSPIVGENDEQPLDRTTIGLINPRQARFKTMSMSRIITASDDVTIPFGFCCIVGGDLEVSGDLAVEGDLVVI